MRGGLALHRQAGQKGGCVGTTRRTKTRPTGGGEANPEEFDWGEDGQGALY